ncbi:MAG: phosphatidylglycerol lysyltransferase domain-containing protein [Desulfobacterales bacterium]
MKFKKLTPDDYPKLKNFFINQKYQHSAYCLTSIIAWSTEFYHPVGATDGDTLFVGAEFIKHPDRRHLIMPISINSEFNPKKLYQIAKDTGYHQYFFVPEEYINTYGKDRIASLFTVTEQTAFKDYVYLTQDLATLEGNKYSKKRNLINQFKREFVTRKFVKTAPITKDIADECIDFLEKWCEERKCDKETDEELYCEKQAAINTIKNVDLLGVDSLFLRLDGKISAFGMASRLTPDMGVFHFEKAFSEIKGLYQYFDNLCAKKLFKQYSYINKESDMDLPGLAKAKKSYYPIKMIKSFRLVLR